ncbi:hypothetical protein QUF76_06065, partial [Desulfobacterales bacterium HSG16]|nr:hypothetical protein [Desulfobacterales bacterium HSG16]
QPFFPLRVSMSVTRSSMVGAVFCFIYFFLPMLLMGLTTFLKNNAPIIKASLFAPYITSVSEMMSRTISEDMKKKYKEKVDSFRKAWEEKNK